MTSPGLEVSREEAITIISARELTQLMCHIPDVYGMYFLLRKRIVMPGVKPHLQEMTAWIPRSVHIP